jgi:hypothetical protein
MLEIIKKALYFLLGKKTVSDRVLTMVTRDWQEVAVLLKGESPSQLKQALILADRSLDSALKDLVVGQTMGDRLKNAKNLFTPQSYDKIWQAHKLRNSVVHESGFEVQGFMVKASVERLKAGLAELGVKL